VGVFLFLQKMTTKGFTELILTTAELIKLFKEVHQFEVRACVCPQRFFRCSGSESISESISANPRIVRAQDAPVVGTIEDVKRLRASAEYKAARASVLASYLPLGDHIKMVDSATTLNELAMACYVLWNQKICCFSTMLSTSRANLKYLRRN
jgi:hypothetical protein